MKRRLFHVLLVVLGLIAFTGLTPAQATGSYPTTYTTTTDKKINGLDSVYVSLGSTVTVTIKSTAKGDAYRKQLLSVRDELPSCLDYVEGTASPAAEAVPPGAGGVISWAGIYVSNGSSRTVTFKAKVVSGAGGTCTNQGYTTSDKSPQSYDKVVITVKGKPDALVDKNCTPDLVAPNGVVNCTIKVTNVGTAGGTFTVKDDMDPGLTYVAGSTTNAAEATIAANTPSAGRTTLTWNAGFLAAGASKTIGFQQRVPATGAPGLKVFTDIGSATVPGDPNPNNNKDPETTTVNYPNPGNSDPAISKTAPATANPGQEITHTLNFSNAGTVQATGVTIEDTLGAGLTFVAGSARLNGQPVAPAQNGQKLTFTIGTLNGGQSGTITYQVRTAAQWPTSGVKSLTDTAVIKSTSADSNPNNNSSTATTKVNYQPLLTLGKDGCRETVVSGGFQTYTLSFNNIGTAPATNVSLVDTVPPGQTIAEAEGATVNGQVATWQLGNLAPNTPGSRELTTLVTAPNGSTVTNSATIDGTNTAPTSAGSSTPVSNAGAAASGKAYVLDVKAPFITLAELVKSESSQTGTGVSNDAAGPVVNVDVPDLLSLEALSSTSNSTVGAGSSNTTSTTNVANVDLLDGLIQAQAVNGVTQSVAGPFGASSNFNGTTFEGLVINGVQYNDVAPNTPIQAIDVPGVGLVEIMLNEQETTATEADGVYTTTASLNMIRVTVKDPLGIPALDTNIIVGHSESSASYPSGRPCEEIGNTVSGKAFTAYVLNALLGTEAYVSKAEITPLGGSSSADIAANVPDVITTGTATNNASGSIGNPPHGHARSSAQTVNVLDGLVTADVLTVTSDSEATGAAADTVFGFNFVNLRIDGTPILDPDIPPNTTINLPNPGGGIISIVLNEQIENGDGTANTEGTINAVHVRVLSTTGLATEVIAVSAHSDAHKGS